MCAKRKIIETSQGDMYADQLGKSDYKAKPKPCTWKPDLKARDYLLHAKFPQDEQISERIKEYENGER
jgi:hypothetical protein